MDDEQPLEEEIELPPKKRRRSPWLMLGLLLIIVLKTVANTKAQSLMIRHQ